MAKIHIKQINNTPASAGDAIVFNGTQNVWAPVQQVVDRVQNLYVGKHGNDANDGLTPEKAFLTFGAAITAATAATPSSTNPFRIACEDGGRYSESITVPSWVYVDAPGSTLLGNLVLSDDSEARFFEIEASTGSVVSKSGTTEARVDAGIIRATGTANTVVNNGTTSVLLVNARQLFVQNGSGVSDLSTAAAGHVHIELEDLYITGTGTGIVCSAAQSRIVGNISHVLEVGGGIGNGIGIDLSNGLIDLQVGRFETTTAYNISGGTLRILVNNLTGIRNQTSGSAVVDVLEANSIRWISITNADSPYTPRRIEYLNVDTTGGAITVELPAAASDGDAIYFQDATRNFSTNAVTFDPNGNTIDGNALPLVIDNDGQAGQLVFLAATNDWSFSTNTVGVSPENLIYVSKNGSDTTGTGSFEKPFLTVKKGVQTANALATSVLPVSVNVLDGVYDEINPITMNNEFVTVVGNSETSVIIQPTVNGQPLFIMSSSTLNLGPGINNCILRGNATYRTTSGSSLVRVTGDGRFTVNQTNLGRAFIGYDTGNGTISGVGTQECIFAFGIIRDCATAIDSKSTTKTVAQVAFLRENTVAVRAANASRVELGSWEIAGLQSGQNGTGIISLDTSDVFLNSGYIRNLVTAFQAEDTSVIRVQSAYAANNTTDINQVDATATVIFNQGTIDKNKLLITDGSNVALTYVDFSSEDFIVGSPDVTGDPGLEFRVRQFDGRIAIGDQATNAHIASGGVGGSRTVNLIDTNGNIRVWRFTETSADPAVELIHGINPINVDSIGDAPITSIDATTNTITVDVSGADYNDPLAGTPGVDRTTLAARAFPVGRQFRVNGTASNNANFTVSSSTYNSGPQTISVVTTQDITVTEGAGGTCVFGGGAGRTDGVSTFIGNPAGAIAAGTGNTWWDFFQQEDDSFRIRRRTGGIGEGTGNKARFFIDRTEILGSTTYSESDQQFILVAQSTASAAAYTTISNASAVLGPQIIATGAATDIPIRIDPKGAGRIVLDGVQWPAADGLNGQVLTTNGAGSASWTTISAGTGTVTSVAATAPAAGLTIAGSPITTSGTLTFALANDLAAVEGLATTGVAVRTGTDTWATRTLTAPAAGLTITNPAGIAGNPTFALANDLAAYEGLTTNGLVTRTADGAATTRTITAGSASIVITNGDGVAGNPTVDLGPISLDNLSDVIITTPASGQTIRFNGTNWVNIADNTGTVTSVAATAPAAGLTITGSPITTSGTLTFALANDLAALEALAATGIPARTATDTWAVRTLTAPAAGLTITNPAGIAGNPTFALANDLLGVEGLATNGLAVRTATDTWTTRSIAGTVGRVVVTNGDGIAGNPTVDLATSGVTAGTYTSVTVDVYGRVTAATNPAGITISTIDGQPVPTFTDTTRSKTLSVETIMYEFSEATVGNSDWIQIGTAVDTLTGYIVPHNATIVKVTGHTSNTNGSTKGIVLFIDGVSSGTIGTFTGAGEQEFSSVTTNIDVTAGQKLRLQGDAAGGTIEDTVITLYVKWRA